MNIKTIIGIVVVILLAGGGYFLFTSQTAEAPMDDMQDTMQDDSMDTDTMMDDMSEGTDTMMDEKMEDKDDAMSDTASDADTVATTVRYTANGFSPETVTVTAGQAVKFINESDRSMWVASNIHPTHTLYPQKSDDDCLGSSFDMCEGVGTGLSWTFTFDEVGEWEYHNHVRANHRGTINVEAADAQ